MSALVVYPYQRKWINEPKRRSIYLKARQIGITWGTMLGVVIDCLKRRTSWYYLSASERLAEEAIEYAQIHLQAMKAGTSVEASEVLFEGVRERQLSIRFPNGSKLVGLPANPRTARGAPGNIVLDEFAHHQDAQKIYTAAYPMSTRGHLLRILSTPNGKQGAFHELWESAEEKGFAAHKTDIYQAKADGFDVDIDDLRKGFTSEAWAQEYECDFLDESMAWLPYHLIESAYSSQATSEIPLGYAPAGEVYLGMDVARKRDLTVYWAVEEAGEEYITRAVKSLHQATYESQEDAFDGFMPLCTRGCIDANGVGSQLAERAEKRWPSMAEGVSLNGQVPAIIATRIKDCFERGVIKIPNDPEIRKDLHMVRRTVTAAGNVRFEAPRTKDGHADRFWALGLALHAADKTAASAWSWAGGLEDEKKLAGKVPQDKETRRAAARRKAEVAADMEIVKGLVPFGGLGQEDINEAEGAGFDPFGFLDHGGE